MQCIAFARQGNRPFLSFQCRRQVASRRHITPPSAPLHHRPVSRLMLCLLVCYHQVYNHLPVLVSVRACSAAEAISHNYASSLLSMQQIMLAWCACRIVCVHYVHLLWSHSQVVVVVQRSFPLTPVVEAYRPWAVSRFPACRPCLYRPSRQYPECNCPPLRKVMFCVCGGSVWGVWTDGSSSFYSGVVMSVLWCKLCQFISLHLVSVLLLVQNAI